MAWIVHDLSGKPPPMGRFGKFEAASAAGMASAPVAAATGARGEAISALVNLGYTQGDAARAVAHTAGQLSSDNVSDLIRSALKELAK